jgi:4-hydroxy-tetrahydrodipicolinate synthase
VNSEQPGLSARTESDDGAVRTGVLVPLVTPFHRGQVDWGSLRRAASWFADTGVDALWLNGTTSEFHALHEDELVEVVRVVADAAGSEIPVIAHVGAPATRLATSLARRCVVAGADAVAAVPPYYLPYSEHEVIAYFRAVSEAAGRPLFAYNIPALTKVAVSTRAVLTLTVEEVIVGVKDTQWTVAEIGDLTGAATAKGLEVPVFVGDATKLSEALYAGAAGTVTAISNVLPRYCLRLVAAAQDADQNLAESLQRDLTEAVGLTVLPTRPSAPRIAAVKYLLAEMGVIEDPETAAPFDPLTATERAELKTKALPLIQRLENNA